MKRRAGILLATAIALVGTLTATAGAGVTAKPAEGEPIKIGVIGINSGFGATPQITDSMQAYVNAWNKRGGYKGHPIQLIVEDGALDAGKTGAAAHKLVDQDQVVAVTAFAILDCKTNGAYYKARGVPAIGGGALVDDQCRSDHYFMPGKQGGTDGLTVAVKWAAETGSKKLGILLPDPARALADPLQAYVKANPDLHLQLVIQTTPLAATAADIDSAIAGFKAAGTDAVIPLGLPDTIQLELEAANVQAFGLNDGIRWINAPTLYNKSILSSATYDGAYVLVQTFPAESKNKQVKKALKVLKGVDNVDGFALGGYQRGALLEQVLNTVKGPITRDSVTAALQKATNIKVPLTAMRNDLVNSKNNPEGGQIVQVKDGKFVIVSDFITTN